MSYYKKTKEGNGYEYAYIYPGMNKVLQAAGRVIRTEDDCGIIALFKAKGNKSPDKAIDRGKMKWNRVPGSNFCMKIVCTSGICHLGVQPGLWWDLQRAF